MARCRADKWSIWGEKQRRDVWRGSLRETKAQLRPGRHRKKTLDSRNYPLDRIWTLALQLCPLACFHLQNPGESTKLSLEYLRLTWKLIFKLRWLHCPQRARNHIYSSEGWDNPRFWNYKFDLCSQQSCSTILPVDTSNKDVILFCIWFYDVCSLPNLFIYTPSWKFLSFTISKVTWWYHSLSLLLNFVRILHRYY